MRRFYLARARRVLLAWGMRHAAALWVLVALLLPSEPARSHSAPPPFAFTHSGLVVGVREDGAEKFLGIPFAAPPVGDLRWRAPQPVAPWRGVLKATALPNECAQLASANGPGSTSEDCLYLSVYRPARVLPLLQRPLPVLIWIHGGGGVNGSGNQQDASELAATTGTIVVMVNYRLGVFGFLALPGLSAESSDGSSGNLGLLDQQAAMRWVQRNIRWFGGDPRNVTIAGQSAGGHSVCLHLASPTAKGLFDRAIIHSGAFDLLGADSSGEPCATTTLAVAEAAGASYASDAMCADPATQVACLRAKSPAELLAASANFSAKPNASGAFLPVPVLDAIAAGDWNRVPVMVGSTHDELQPAAALVPFLGYPLPEFLYQLAVGFVFPAKAGAVLAEYPSASYADPAFAFGALLTDAGFSCPTDRLRRFLAPRTPTFGFEFADPNAPPGVSGTMPSGAYHTSDVQYLFRYSPPNGAFTPEQAVLSHQMQRYWAAFARSGFPFVPRQAFWPRFDESQARVMTLAPTGNAVTTDFAAFHHCDFWAPPAP
jgi:para-nitrobenzyl esterase